MNLRRLPVLIALAAAIIGVAALFAACDGRPYAPQTGDLTSLSGKDDKGNLLGAGATFPAIVYQAWFYDYNHKVAPGVQINYQSIGSGGGIQQFTEGLIDFGATDAPMNDADLARAPGTLHLPTVLGAVVLTYNLDGLTQPLRIDGATTAALFLGEITMWDDPRLAALNPGVALPSVPVRVVYRTDGSGTSFVFTDWLAKVSPEWKARVGKSKNPNWPTGFGGKGNEGVTQVVAQTPGAIGYVELNYAAAKKLAFADVKNRAGAFVHPSIDSVSAAAAGVELPDDYRVSITDPDGESAYPIATFTFLLLHRDADNCTRQRVLVHFLWWAYHDPAAIALTRSLLYAPLPPPVLTRIDASLRSLTCDSGIPVVAPVGTATGS